MGNHISDYEDPESKNIFFKIIPHVFHYIFLLAIISIVALNKPTSNKPFTVAGFSIFNVTSTSMESVIPKGSLILVKKQLPENYLLGDDITYYDIGNTKQMVTHRIIDVQRDNMGYLYKTQGVENVMPDAFLVPPENTIGKVVLSINDLGYYLSYIQENPLVVILLFVLLLLTIKSLKRTLAPRKIKD